MTRAAAMREKQDPAMASLTTPAARMLLREARTSYEFADRASQAERRVWLREAAVATQAMRKAEGEARA